VVTATRRHVITVERKAARPKRSGRACAGGRGVSTWRLGARVWMGIPRALPCGREVLF
jgi:hypothetical protein